MRLSPRATRVGSAPRKRASHTLARLKTWPSDSWPARATQLTRTPLRALGQRLQWAAIQSAEYARPNMFWVGLVTLIWFPLYYIIWHTLFPQSYENLPLRLLGAALAAPLLVVEHLPWYVQRYVPVYWLVLLCYALPFFFTFMLLENDASTIWAMSTMAAAVLLVLLVNDWLLLTLVTIGGGSLAWLCFYLSGGRLAAGLTETLIMQLPIYVFVLVSGSLFNYKTELVKQQKLKAVAATSSTIAHELRTPLLSIRSGINGLNRYLPQLLEGYDLARDNGLPVHPIRTAHRRELEPVLQRIDVETQYSNMIIDILLFNTRGDHIDTTTFVPVAMSDCITAALNRYPFKSDHERGDLHWQTEHDFMFNGSRLLMMHVIFNLIKNALQSTAAAGEGHIMIWMARKKRGYSLYFRDTGQGVNADDLPFIFDRFYSTKKDERGAGIGLAFCKMVMKSFGGRINCSSIFGEFTQFELHFPGAQTNEHA